jgi:hypothetical protein
LTQFVNVLFLYVTIQLCSHRMLCFSSIESHHGMPHVFLAKSTVLSLQTELDIHLNTCTHHLQSSLSTVNVAISRVSVSIENGSPESAHPLRCATPHFLGMFNVQVFLFDTMQCSRWYKSPIYHTMPTSDYHILTFRIHSCGCGPRHQDVYSSQPSPSAASASPLSTASSLTPPSSHS